LADRGSIVTGHVIVTRIDLILGKRCLAFASHELIKETIECVYPDAVVTVAVGIATKVASVETDPDLPYSTWSAYMADVANTVFGIIVDRHFQRAPGRAQR
jgi:hypothetical protein